MRKVTVRFSTAEHRVLNSLAAAQGVSAEMLVREALGLAPIDTHTPTAEHLEIVGGTDTLTRCDNAWDDVIPVA